MSERFTAKQVIEAMQGTYGIKSDIAQRLRCARGTVDNYIIRYPSVARAWQDERGKLVDLAQGKLRVKLEDGQDWAIRFTLSTLGKNDGFTERHEITGADGGPVETAVHYVNDWRRDPASVSASGAADDLEGE